MSFSFVLLLLLLLFLVSLLPIAVSILRDDYTLTGFIRILLLDFDLP